MGSTKHLPGPAPNSAGPHRHDILNKLDPTVDDRTGGVQLLGSGVHPNTHGAAPMQSAVPGAKTNNTTNYDHVNNNNRDNVPLAHQGTHTSPNTTYTSSADTAGHPSNVSGETTPHQGIQHNNHHAHNISGGPMAHSNTLGNSDPHHASQHHHGSSIPVVGSGGAIPAQTGHPAPPTLPGAVNPSQPGHGGIMHGGNNAVNNAVEPHDSVQPNTTADSRVDLANANRFMGPNSTNPHDGSVAPNHQGSLFAPSRHGTDASTAGLHSGGHGLSKRGDSIAVSQRSSEAPIAVHPDANTAPAHGGVPLNGGYNGVPAPLSTSNGHNGFPQNGTSHNGFNTISHNTHNTHNSTPLGGYNTNETPVSPNSPNIYDAPVGNHHPAGTGNGIVSPLTAHPSIGQGQQHQQHQQHQQYHHSSIQHNLNQQHQQHQQPHHPSIQENLNQHQSGQPIHGQQFSDQNHPHLSQQQQHHSVHPNHPVGGTGNNISPDGPLVEGHTAHHSGASEMVYPGPASKTAGPHKSNFLNKLDPSVDSKVKVPAVPHFVFLCFV